MLTWRHLECVNYRNNHFINDGVYEGTQSVLHMVSKHNSKQYFLTTKKRSICIQIKIQRRELRKCMSKRTNERTKLVENNRKSPVCLIPCLINISEENKKEKKSNSTTMFIAI